MAAELHENDTMFSHREVPWHKKGVVVSEAPNAAEAIKLGGLDWHVSKLPVYCGGAVVPRRVGLVREDTQEVLSVVSEQYEVVQNIEAFDFIESLIGEELEFETAGSLFNGRKVFISTKWQKKWGVGDDEIDLYLLLSNAFTGIDSLKVAVTPVRVVCNNTLQAALRHCARVWSVNHYSTLNEKINEARNALRISTAYMERFVEFGNRAVDAKVGEGKVEELVDLMFPKRDVMSEVVVRHREGKIREFERYYDAADIRPYRGSVWGLVNAVADYEMHRKQSADALMNRTLRGEQKLLNQAISFLGT